MRIKTRRFLNRIKKLRLDFVIQKYKRNIYEIEEIINCFIKI